MSAYLRKRLRRLYDACLRELDRQLTPWIEHMDTEATLLVTGDHGEEFSRDIVGHARLYDDTVRVPLLTNASAEVANRWRHLDVSPTICEWLDIDQPDSWEGRPATDTMVPQPLMGMDTGRERKYLGIRSTDQKEIRTYDWDGSHLRTERFDLTTDPDETNPEATISASLRERMDEFTSRQDIQEHFEVQGAHGLDDDVSDRLSDLGYT